ncbi:DUF7684 family protein [Hymenobacter sp.]|jgi:hypothetical protein|uniref:DUF7684 family protein n=1 Tax=Hymenobacter sp. TaxID=1898978 RepID=UPI002EDAD074
MLLNNRKITITKYSTEKPWLKEIPDQDWLCILVVDNIPRRYLDEVLPKLLLKNICWLCTVGSQCEFVHDLMDEEIIYRQVEETQPHLPKHFVFTSWHEDFNEGFSFAIYAARHDAVDIKNVVVLDMTNGIDQARIESALTQAQDEA